MYRITDRKGDDFYNDTDHYETLAEAQAELARAIAWATEQAKSEPTWKNANLISVEEPE